MRRSRICATVCTGSRPIQSRRGSSSRQEFTFAETRINLTGLQAINMVIDGCGSVIHGRWVGQAVLDAMGARWLELRDLTVIGDKVEVPRVGLQLGRVSDAVA